MQCVVCNKRVVHTCVNCVYYTPTHIVHTVIMISYIIVVFIFYIVCFRLPDRSTKIGDKKWENMYSQAISVFNDFVSVFWLWGSLVKW